MIDREITPELARIVAHICGDGYLYISKVRRCKSDMLSHPKKNPIKTIWGVRYVNTTPFLATQFIKDVKKEFNRKIKPLRKHKHDLAGKWTYEIITALGAGKSKDWFISDKILSASNKIKIEWLKAFFDDEAHVSKERRRIVLNIVNKKGLEQIQRMLETLGINSSIRGPYFCKQFYSYHLTIYKAESKKYFDLIGFYHPKKQRALESFFHLEKNGAAGKFSSSPETNLSTSI